MLLATWIVFKPFSRWVPYPVYWVLAPFVVVGLLIVTYRLLARYAPGLLGTVLGTPVSRQPKPGAVPGVGAAPVSS